MSEFLPPSPESRHISDTTDQVDQNVRETETMIWDIFDKLAQQRGYNSAAETLPAPCIQELSTDARTLLKGAHER
jgi:hypothetical protein